MCIDLNQTAFQLANEIKRVLDSDVRIRISLNKATFFEYDSDEDAVIVAPVSLLEIEEKEKAQISSRAAYELVLMSAKTSARKFNGILCLTVSYIACIQRYTRWATMTILSALPQRSFKAMLHSASHFLSFLRAS